MRRGLTGLVLCLSCLPATPAPADLIQLRSGGELRGTLKSSNPRAPEVVIETLTGATVVVRRDEISLLSVRSLTVEEYETRLRSTPETADAHWDLAAWCQQNRLVTQRRNELEHILLLDPDHAGAHKALGHVQENGDWMTRDEQMARRGYIKHKGKYLTRHELDLLQKTEAERGAEREWFAKVYPWVNWLTGNNERQRGEAYTNLRKIDDPAAVPALTTHMATHEQLSVRKLFVEILARISGPRPIEALVHRSLFDGNSAVRQAAIAALEPDQYEAAVDLYLPALFHNDNPVVNRAAVALAVIADPKTIPPLIDALVTNHSFKVTVPDTGGVNVSIGGGGTGFVSPSAISGYLPPEVEGQLLTGQLPYGVVVLPPLGMPQKTKQVKVQAQLTNDDVLAALQKLTGQDFGFDERTWLLWWASRGKTGPVSAS